MEKWEYNVITTKREMRLFAKSVWSVDVEAMLPELGEDGWELVSVTPISSQYGESVSGYTTEEKWVFKRPKADT